LPDSLPSSMGLAKFWAVLACSSFTNCFPTWCTHYSDVGDSKHHLWIVNQLLQDYTDQYPRRVLSQYLPPWEPEISLNND
jgi:hypothetical protein